MRGALPACSRDTTGANLQASSMYSLISYVYIQVISWVTTSPQGVQLLHLTLAGNESAEHSEATSAAQGMRHQRTETGLALCNYSAVAAKWTRRLLFQVGRVGTAVVIPGSLANMCDAAPVAKLDARVHHVDALGHGGPALVVLDGVHLHASRTCRSGGGIHNMTAWVYQSNPTPTVPVTRLTSGGRMIFSPNMQEARRKCVRCNLMQLVGSYRYMQVEQAHLTTLQQTAWVREAVEHSPYPLHPAVGMEHRACRTPLPLLRQDSDTFQASRGWPPHSGMARRGHHKQARYTMTP